MIRDPSDGSTKGHKRPSINALKARYGDDWGIKPPPEPERPIVKAMTAEELNQHYAKHDIGFTPKINQLGRNQD